jgi:HEAT repeat protein
VKSTVDEFWDRIVEMVDDSDPKVRYQVLHNLCDGSPKSMEEKVIETIEYLHNDPDKYIRRRVHQILAGYRKTGKWNVL